MKHKKSLKWIKKQLIESYSYSKKDIGRKLVITKSFSNYGSVGYILIALDGSPPKGCALYQPDHKFLIIIDAWGKTKKYSNIILDIDIGVKKSNGKRNN